VFTNRHRHHSYRDATDWPSQLTQGQDLLVLCGLQDIAHPGERPGIRRRGFTSFVAPQRRILERAGVSRTVARTMIGHKTESMYRRSSIVDEARMREEAEKLQAWEAASKSRRSVTVASVNSPKRAS
jgi:hypothetical protein